MMRSKCCFKWPLACVSEQHAKVASHYRSSSKIEKRIPRVAMLSFFGFQGVELNRKEGVWVYVQDIGMDR